MSFGRMIEKSGMTSLKIKASVLEMEFKLKTADKDAAWDLYIELLTRITTQPLSKNTGDEEAALSSIHSIFRLTRAIIKTHKRHCIVFTKIAIIILNQIIRPFTSKWHKELLKNNFKSPKACKDFRSELSEIQKFLQKYTKMLADMADVEDLTELENVTKNKK